MKELMLIQSELKVPKGQFNSFGKYNYRSCGDILEAVKPLLLKHKCSITMSDEVMAIGDRFYVKAEACLSNGSDAMTITAFAREALTKKGMDEAQITGAASSYARKYALCGLLAIDDERDSDTTNTHGKEEKKQAPVTNSNPKIQWLKAKGVIIPENATKRVIDELFDKTKAGVKNGGD